MLRIFSALTGMSIFESLMMIYITIIVFTFLFVAIVHGQTTPKVTTRQSFLMGGLFAVLVAFAGMIFISIFTSYNASYKGLIRLLASSNH